MGWIGRMLAAAAACCGVGLLSAAGGAAAQPQTVLVVQVKGVITPVVADLLTDAVSAAERDGHQALLVDLDTPGGLDTSMREIVQLFLAADVPVVVYVSPPGARAASAGALITFAAHVAAMAPGTTVGAATPVDASTGEKASDKVINDAAAFAESVATHRGRNTEFAIATVREGRAVAADEALQIGAVDLIAADLPTLLSDLDGRQVRLPSGTVVLHTAQAQPVAFELDLFRRLLQVIADPNLAFLFLSIGTLAVIYEAATPGVGFAGIAGVILLILGFFSLSVLPYTVAGIALLVLAAGLFLAEVFTPGIGVFALGGAISLALAGLFLFDEPTVRVNPGVFVPTAVVVGAGALVAGRMAWRARRAPTVSGSSTMIGQRTVVAELAGEVATVWLAGAWWRARSSGPALERWQPVHVTAVDGLTLIVEPVEAVDVEGNSDV